MVRDLLKAISDNVKWFIHKDEIQEQIKIDTHKLDMQKTEISKLRHYKETNEELKKEIEKLKLTIKKKNKKIREMKKNEK